MLFLCHAISPVGIEMLLGLYLRFGFVYLIFQFTHFIYIYIIITFKLETLYNPCYVYIYVNHSYILNNEDITVCHET